MLNTYLVPGIIFVLLSYLGFFIDPMATPARVTLGMVCARRLTQHPHFHCVHASRGARAVGKYIYHVLRSALTASCAVCV